MLRVFWGVLQIGLLVGCFGMGTSLLLDFIQFSRLKEGDVIYYGSIWYASIEEYVYAGSRRIISVRKDGWRTVEIGLDTGETLTFRQLLQSDEYGM